MRAAAGPVRYEVERAGSRLTVELAPRPLDWGGVIGRFGVYVLVSAIMLGVGALVYVQNPVAAPNRRFLLYMCLWARLERGGPGGGAGRAHLGRDGGRAGRAAPVHPRLGLLPDLPGQPGAGALARAPPGDPALYRLAGVLGLVGALAYVLIVWRAPALLVDGWVYPASAAVLSLLSALSFPIKIGALLDTKRRAASPLVDQQTTVLLLGIAIRNGAKQANKTILFHKNIPIAPVGYCYDFVDYFRHAEL